MLNSRFKFGIASTLLISGFLPLAGSILVQLYLSDWHWIQEPLHLVVEGTGAFIALLVAVLLLLQMQVEKNIVHYTWVASALIAMGVFDGFHAALHSGAGFVWTHSMATLAGGFLFSLICLSEHLARTRFAKSFPPLVAILATAVGIFIAVFPDQLPSMVNSGGFTLAAKASNSLGGLFFMAAGAWLILRYRRQGSRSDLLFANQCLLFGVAGLLFAYSTLWDAAWWYWHLLRLLAYFVVLGYAFSVYYGLQEGLRGSEIRNRALLNAIPDMIFRFQLDGTLLDFQAHDASPMVRMHPQEMIGANIHNSPMSPEAVDQIMAASRRAAETREIQTIEFALPRDSELRLFESRIVASGPEELVAIVRNITGQKRAEESLRESEAKFRSLAESTATGVFIYQGEQIRYVNPAAEALTGYRHEELLKMRFWELVPTDLREAVRERGLARQRGGPIPPRYEQRIITKSGEERWLYVAAAETIFGGEPAVVVTAFDITERKRIEEELHRSESRTRALLNAIPDLMFRYRLDGTFLDFHAQDPGELMMPPEAVVTSNISQSPMPREVVDRILAASRQAIETGKVQTVEYVLDLPNGENIYEARIVASGPEELVAIVRNITAQKRAEEDLRALTSRLISAREEETKRLARELHDAFSQRLAVLGMSASALEQQLPPSDALRQTIQALGAEIGRLAQDVHQLSRELHPSILDDLGLAAALRAECAAFSRQHNIPVRFEPVNVPELLPGNVSLSLYRIAQESLRNIGKHAGATAVRVTLLGDTDVILLVIEDNGSGFQLDQIRGNRGLGLVSMEERVRLVDGDISIQSRPGTGTTVEARIPLARSRE